MKNAIRNLKSAIILSLLFLLLPTTSTSQAQTQSSSNPAWSWPDEWQADSAFFNVWSRPDAPVAMQAASRSWLWGPVPFAVANEPYAESPTNLRLVEYLDKGRMEINDPTSDRTSPWFVTSGLLVNEMVTGQYQTGNNTFQTRPPSDIPVAGDAFSPDAPTFASFANFTRRDQNEVPCCDNIEIRNPSRINRDGTLGGKTYQDLFSSSAIADQLVFWSYDETTGHNIPRVFADWMAQSGPILENGQLTTSNLFDPLYLLGHPITEPYWADIRIDGKPTTVLIQLYERRALTYNPANPPEWQVEMANVGRAYYNWLYRETLPTPAIATNLSTQGATNSILFHGYNWPPNTPIHLRIAVNNSPDSLIGPLDITTNPQGRFASNLLYTPQLEAAQKSKADIRAYAESNGTTISLPFATPSTSAPIPISGTIIGIENAAAQNTYTLTLASSEGDPIRVQVTPSTSITFAEGTLAHPSDLDINAYISLQATQSAPTLTAISLQLLSTSSTHAWIGYKWAADKKHLTVTGASWPPSTNVSFTLCNTSCAFVPQAIPQGYYGVPEPFATLKTDSRGNLTGTIPISAISSLRLLQADAGNRGTVTHLIAPDSNSNGPDLPEITLISQNGMQLAEFGPFCLSDCGDLIIFNDRFPSFALSASRGETLTFRSQYGPNPNLSLSPESYSLYLYPFPTDNPFSEPVPFEYHATPPVLSADYSSGYPFSFTIPSSLAVGKYTLGLQIAWPIDLGEISSLPYAMIIDVK